MPQIDTVFVLVPFATARLYFTINGGVIAPSSRLCWHLTLIGCTLSEGETCTPKSAYKLAVAEVNYETACATYSNELIQLKTLHLCILVLD